MTFGDQRLLINNIHINEDHLAGEVFSSDHGIIIFLTWSELTSEAEERLRFAARLSQEVSEMSQTTPVQPGAHSHSYSLSRWMHVPAF